MKAIEDMTQKELVTEALNCSRFGINTDPKMFSKINEILEELKWYMRDSEFNVFKERINTLLNEE